MNSYSIWASRLYIRRKAQTVTRVVRLPARFSRIGYSEALLRRNPRMYTFNQNVCANRISLFGASPDCWNLNSAVEESSSPGAFHHQSQPLSRERQCGER